MQQQQRTIDLTAVDGWTLSAGAHDSPDDGACVMEAVAYVAGEPWSDSPQCASPVIAAFCRTWNDTEEWSIAMRTVVMDRNHVAGWFVGLLDNHRVVRLWGPYDYEEAKRIAASVARAELNATELAYWRKGERSDAGE